jgi:hypothetical protein
MSIGRVQGCPTPAERGDRIAQRLASAAGSLGQRGSIEKGRCVLWPNVAANRIPATFSRNATAHTVSSRQFNRRNAVQGLLFACSLLYFFNEQAVVRAA